MRKKKVPQKTPEQILPPVYYDREFAGFKMDPYRVISILGITEPEQQHAIKKLMRAGLKPGEDVDKAIREVIWTLQRWLDRREEDRAIEEDMNR